MAAGQHEAALSAFAEAETLDADFAELSFRSGQCLLQLDRNAQAAAAFFATQDVVDAMRAGACDYLAKPFDLAELEHRVARALDSANRSC